jgi:hypothetical protein
MQQKVGLYNKKLDTLLSHIDKYFILSLINKNIIVFYFDENDMQKMPMV